MAGTILVDRAVAVVVRVVADLGGTGVDAGVGVVAIVGVGDVALGLGAGAGGEVPPVPIVVDITIPDGGGILIHLVVAIVVETVADLSGARIGCHYKIIAVRAVGHVARGLGAGCGADGRVTVVVVVIVETPRGGLDALVDVAIAVVIDAVADLSGTRMDVGVFVVAVLVTGDAVAVVVFDAGGVGVVGVVTVDTRVGDDVSGLVFSRNKLVAGCENEEKEEEKKAVHETSAGGRRALGGML